MPAFEIADIQSACEAVHAFLVLDALEPGSRDVDEAKARARTKLDKLS